jgi:hypothetical protein
VPVHQPQKRAGGLDRELELADRFGLFQLDAWECHPSELLVVTGRYWSTDVAKPGQIRDK